MNRLFRAGLAAFVAMVSFDAMAACQCMCVNGQVEAMCSSAIDLRPVCAPRVCPLTPPSVAPINRPRVPPIGTSECHMVQVLNPFSHRYEWKQVCD